MKASKSNLKIEHGSYKIKSASGYDNKKLAEMSVKNDASGCVED